MVDIKSKERVRKFGEVFTPEWLVKDMLDLVKSETDRIDSTFLEPACGTGNFLIEILRRKLNVVEARYKGNQLDYERYAAIAIASMYGIDILEDNIIHCRKRLYTYFDLCYTKIFKQDCKEDYRNSIKTILVNNIICGDSLTMKTNCGKDICL